MTWRDVLVHLILSSGAVRRGRFILAGGQESHYYLDLRLATVDWRLAAIGEELLLALRPWSFTAVAGPSTGADPLVSACLILADRPLRGGFVRLAAKDHGTGRQIGGSIQPGDRTALLEDVTTTGRSLLQAAVALEEFGCPVVGAVALVDRTGQAGPLLAERGIPFNGLLTPVDLGVEEAVHAGA